MVAIAIGLGLGDIGIYCHDISQQKVSRYYYISRYFLIFSQPEANYTIECIILMYDTFIAIHTVYSYEVYFMTAAVIVILVNTVLISTAYRLV